MNTTINQIFIVNEKEVTLMKTFLATMTSEQLEQKVCSLENKKDEIISSIDFLITGF